MKKRTAKGLPDSVARAVARQHPELARKMGLVSPLAQAALQADAADAAKPRRGTKGGLRTWRGTLRFDSETEAIVYDNLKARFRAVFAHGRLALSDEAHVEPDFVVAAIVNDTKEPMTVTLQPGEFLGFTADAKGKWRGKTKAHVERDAAVKYKWAKEAYGLVISILTKHD